MELISKNKFLINNGIAAIIAMLLVIADMILGLGISLGVLIIILYVHYLTIYRLIAVDMKPSWVFISITGVGWIFLFIFGLKESVIENNKMLKKYNTSSKRILITLTTGLVCYVLLPIIMFLSMMAMLQIFINSLF